MLKEIFKLIAESGRTDLMEEWYKIEKDLELLAILKKLPFEIYQNGGGDNWSWFIDLKQSFKTSEEKARKIKDWLRRK